MSGWRLVEAVVEQPQEKDKEAKSGSADVRRAPRDGDRPQRRQSKGEGRGRGDNRKQGEQSDSVDTQTLDYYSHLAVQQIECLFSDENLCMDTFIRSYMDQTGAVPFGVVCSYQNVSYFNVNPFELWAKLKATVQAGKSVLEIDEENETVKLKEKWEMWLMPNPAGGRGLPLYSTLNGQHKILVAPVAAPETAATTTTTSATTSATTVPADVAASATESTPIIGRGYRSGSEELSASAPEFKPKSAV